MKKDILESLDNTIFQILDDNKDLVDLQAEKAKLLPKFCERCGRDLASYIECRCKDDVVRPKEYMTWTSIAEDYGGIGAQTYTCYECSEHFRKINHLVIQNCYTCAKMRKQMKKRKN